MRTVKTWIGRLSGAGENTKGGDDDAKKKTHENVLGNSCRSLFGGLKKRKDLKL